MYTENERQARLCIPSDYAELQKKYPVSSMATRKRVTVLLNQRLLQPRYCSYVASRRGVVYFVQAILGLNGTADTVRCYALL